MAWLNRGNWFSSLRVDSLFRKDSRVFLTVLLGIATVLAGFAAPAIWAGPFDGGKVESTATVQTDSDAAQKAQKQATKMAPFRDPDSALYGAGSRYGDGTPDEYLDTIQPIMARRCTVCHGCENSPCSLKLVSYKGLQRGGTQIQSQTDLAVRGYEAIRLKDGPLNGTNAEWKSAWQKDRPEDQRFNPVAPDAEKGGVGADQSLIWEFLKQGNENNKPGFDRTSVRKLEQERYDGGAQQCVANPAEFKRWKAENPMGGMPFGCPGLKRLSDGGYGAGEFDTMEAWIMKGAPGPSAEALADRGRPKNLPTIERWEQYLNYPTNKRRLIARYLYEHLFRAHIHFEESPGEFYMMIRASNPPGQLPVREFVTNAPNDPPRGMTASTTIYYRLEKITDLVALKDHIVWEASNKTLERIYNLFDREAPAWNVTRLPGYESKNPFLYFQAIPPSIRYKFLLDNSWFMLDNLVRSPVCNGSKATFAMDDYVWAWFVHPKADPTAQDGGPAAFSTHQWGLINDGYRVDTRYLSGVEALMQHNSQYLTELEKRQRILKPQGLQVEDIWDGTCLFDPSTDAGDKNRNAWCSALRHETNGSVIYGGEGGKPISVYLFNFSNLERAFYSLSFNYKEWGSLQHKLLTWRDFMHVRLEAEDRFLSLLQPEFRAALRNDWSSGMVGQQGIRVFPDRSLGGSGAPAGARPGDSSLRIESGATPRAGFLSVLDQIVERRFANWPLGPSSINAEDKPSAWPEQITSVEELEAAMNMVTWRQGFFNSRIPSVSFIRIQPQGWVYTMLAHRRYSSHNFITDIVWARKGQGKYDYTSIYRGLIGDYPNLYFDLPLDRAKEFFSSLVKVKTNEEWLALRKRFMVPKNDDRFWSTTDWYHTWMAENMPVQGGILDIREYDNWEIPPESTE